MQGLGWTGTSVQALEFDSASLGVLVWTTLILPACLATFTDMVAPEDFACQDKLAVPNVASCVSLIESYGIVITL